MEPEIYQQVKLSVRTILNIDLTPYKDEQMKRRLDSWLVRSGALNWPEYFKRVRGDEGEKIKFRDYLTINVSSFFRDPERWVDLQNKVAPELLKASPRGLRIWSSGCSIGPEPYTLAMIFQELTPGRHHYILATDLDRGALTRAKARGPFSEDDIRNVSASLKMKHFQPGGPPYYVTEALSSRITFREQNILSDQFEEGFDLIVCRNVVIYFTEAAKDGLYRKFYQALKPGGIMFVGGTEIISHAHEIGFRSVGLSFYKKV